MTCMRSTRRTIEQRRQFNNEIAQSILDKPQRVAYGPAEIEKLDVYKTKRANASNTYGSK